MSKRKWNQRTTDCPSCPEHGVWAAMWQRCNNPNVRSYADYGGRGIKVCDRWRDFFKFVEDLGRRPPGTSLERDDNDGNYEPGNCRWATRQEQIENRRCTIRVTINGVTRALTYWCRKYGVKRDVVKNRFRSHGDWVKAIKEARRNLNHEAILRIEIDGVTKPAREWCRLHGIALKVAWQRVKRDGMTWEQALTTPTIHQKDREIGQQVTIAGVTKSLRQWQLEFGIPSSTVWKRMKRGMTATEALLASKRINQHK